MIYRSEIMRFLLAASIVLIAPAALAQTAPVAKPEAATATQAPADMAERMKLSREYHRIRPIKTRIDATLVQLGQNVPQPQRTRYMADMQANLDYKSIETASISALAETFTPAEIKAMIAYYSSPEGRAIDAKIGGYEKRVEPAVRNAIDRAITKIKYGKTPEK